MSYTKKPITGMKDILPDECTLRDYVKSVINETYRSWGFTPIETPCMENIANLTGGQGGENEKLIFKVLKRGEKLDLANAVTDTDVSDMGMRYDLTVPLSRFYANNENNLPSPFKALQMGNVWRADRPQKGRYRQFMQCDIDILGEASNLAEIELILAAGQTLGKLGFKDFRIRINDRHILKAMALYCGFSEDKTNEIFIVLDKMDKTGADGVRSELVDMGYSKEMADKYLALFELISSDMGVVDAITALKDVLGDYPDEGGFENLITIARSVEAAKNADFELVFDPTLVRGMSYYTGTIFEVALPGLGISCGGGGRYDGMVGRFAGHDVPACGFSLGFERIVLLLQEQGFKIPGEGEKIALLIEKGYPGDRLSEIFAEAARLRNEGANVLTVYMKKNKKHQKELLAEEGYTDIREYFKGNAD